MLWTRRSFLQAGGLMIVSSLTDHTLGWAARDLDQAVVRRTLWAMGGWNFLKVECHDAVVAETALRAAIESIREIEQTYSVFDGRTPLSRLNHSTELSSPIDDPELLGTLDTVLNAAALTGGAFDPSVEPLMHRWGFRSQSPSPASTKPSRVGHSQFRCDLRAARLERAYAELALDSGGWAKGLAAQRAAEAAIAQGAVRAQVNCGCDLYRAGAGRWECLIRDSQPSELSVAFRCRHQYPAVATSANTESYRLLPDGRRVGHLMDPRTQAPAETDIESATAFCHDGLVADALSSALFVMGSPAATSWLRAHPEYGAVLLLHGWRDDSARITTSGGVEIRHLKEERSS